MDTFIKELLTRVCLTHPTTPVFNPQPWRRCTVGGREMEERGKLWVEHGCHLEGWVAEGRENKSWSLRSGSYSLTRQER
eukprot:COSAG06_NODE_4097_length_4578_cov_37.206519_3_plen_79_part_00